MASRKEQKEQARAARLAAEQAAQARAARMRRMQLLGGVVVIAVAAIVVAIAISGGGSGGGAIKQNSPQSRALYSQINTLLTGIPESGTTLGNPKAPVTMTYFGDLECPICRDFTLNTLPQFIQNDVRTGKAKVVYRSMCTATCNDYSNGQSIFNNQQVAAYAAGRQNLFWYYAELFYHQQRAEGSGYVTSTFLNDLAGQIPALKQSTWQTDRKDPSLLSQVQGDEQAASTDNLQGTPTLILQGPKGQLTAPNSVVNPGGYSALASTLRQVS